MRPRLLAFLAALLLSGSLLPGQVILSEFMASNSRTLADDFGAYEDWIEVHNTSASDVNLLDWGLTDASGSPFKWRFPSTNLPSGGYLVVFASNRDRRIPGLPLHTNFKLDPDGEYLALVRPDGSYATRFSQKYPPQVADVSFGFGLDATNQLLVSANSVGRALVPSGGTLGTTWTANNFNDTSWSAATNGIGFETGASEDPGSFAADLAADVPLGWWRFTTGTPLTNSGSLGPNGAGVISGTVTTGIAGPVPADFAGLEATNTAARFNGSNARVDVAFNSSLNPSGAFTVEFWAWPRSTGVSQSQVSSINWNTGSTAPRGGYIFYQNTANQWQFRLSSASAFIATAAGGTINTAGWQHVVGVYDGANARLYVNGTQVATAAVSGFVANSSQPLRFGATGRSGTINYFNGDLDEVAIFNRALSAAEISSRYQVAVYATPPTGVYSYTGLIKTDLRTAMLNVNASAYVRLPFTVTDAASVDTLSLRLKYDAVASRSLVVWSSGAASCAALP